METFFGRKYVINTHAQTNTRKYQERKKKRNYYDNRMCYCHFLSLLETRGWGLLFVAGPWYLKRRTEPGSSFSWARVMAEPSVGSTFSPPPPAIRHPSRQQDGVDKCFTLCLSSLAVNTTSLVQQQFESSHWLLILQ